MAGMKRAGRIVLNGLTGLSLLLCLATVVLWVRSWRSADVLERWEARQMETKGGPSAEDTSQKVASYEGKLTAEFIRWHVAGCIIDNESQRGTWKWKLWHKAPNWNIKFLADSNTAHQLVGLTLQHVDSTSDATGGEIWFVSVPHWFVVSLLAVLPTLFMVFRISKALGPLNGVCKKCGYDLRATPDRCPECGTPAPAPPSTLGQSTSIGA
jgi:hypothetical protein